MNARRTRNGRQLCVVEGEAGEVLCIWEPHVVRSPWEARALAAHVNARLDFDRGRVRVEDSR